MNDEFLTAIIETQFILSPYFLMWNYKVADFAVDQKI